MHKYLLSLSALVCVLALSVSANSKPNIIVLMADDISAREFPAYGSTVWSDTKGGDSSDLQYRAKTPVMDRLAQEGVVIKNAWGAVVCSPSRAMMMTGRYAHLHKWWNNGDQGKWINPETGRKETVPLYATSPIMMGHLAQKSGYGTYWAGKTQVPGDLAGYGFDEGCFTPGNWEDDDNPYADFKLIFKKDADGEWFCHDDKKKSKRVWNLDTGEEVDCYKQHSWNFFPHVRVMNHPDSKKKMDWWPVTPKQIEGFSINTYGGDVELDHIFDFMDRKHDEGKPFFIYHTPRLGHDAFDFLFPESGNKWPGTPVVNWDGEGYTRVKTHITGDNGVYDTHSTVSEPGMHAHLKYLDYQVWQYLEKLKSLGVADNTVFFITADNGTSRYGKNSEHQQRGTHVPFIVYAPGFDLTKQGMQDILVNLADVYPTVANLVGYSVPEDYEVNGRSLWPYLTTDALDHRGWIYGYKHEKQIIRGHKVLRDGRGKWWDVETMPADLTSFDEIREWEATSQDHKKERKLLLEVMKPFDQHRTAHDHSSMTSN